MSNPRLDPYLTLSDLADQASASIDRDQTVPDEVVREFADLLATAMSHDDWEVLCKAQQTARVLAFHARSVLRSRTLPEPVQQRLRAAMLELNALVHVADAGVNLTYPHHFGRTLDPESWTATALRMLADTAELPTGVLASVQTHLSELQVTHALYAMQLSGLLAVRPEGEDTMWSLTDAGRVAAAVIAGVAGQQGCGSTEIS